MERSLPARNALLERKAKADTIRYELQVLDQHINRLANDLELGRVLSYGEHILPIVKQLMSFTRTVAEAV